MNSPVLPDRKDKWRKRFKKPFKLRVLGSTQPARHPQDGWKNADPYPMGSWARGAFRALILAVCPPSPAPHLPDVVDRIELHVRRLMRYMHPLAARALWIAIFILDWAPRFAFFSRHRLQGLTAEEGSLFLSRLGATRLHLLRTLLTGIRGAILSAYFDQDEVHRALGYAPLPFISERRELRAQLIDQAARKRPA
ncbi:MAG TPA: hypothetical protein VK524_04465 [Polyangiaceae bacterium]|nr:hypothetical protein [Polyangiaceae bacterium]